MQQSNASFQQSGRRRAEMSRHATKRCQQRGFGQDVEIEVVFDSQDQWNTIRGQVLDLQGVDDVRVGDVSSRNAQMGLKYPGGGAALASTLALQGLTLRQAGGQWQLRAAY